MLIQAYLIILGLPKATLHDVFYFSTLAHWIGFCNNDIGHVRLRNQVPSCA